MQIFILASGSQERWVKSGGTGLKQFIRVDGEALVERLYRQAQSISPDTTVVVSNMRSPAWKNSLMSLAEPAHEEWMGEMGKFLDTEYLWGPGEVCILYGDAYYSDESLAAIFAEPVDQVTIYGRANCPGRSLESFAIRFRVPEDVEEIKLHALPVAEANQNRRGGPWRWYYHKLTGKLNYSEKQFYEKEQRHVSAGVIAIKDNSTPERGWVEMGHDNLTDDFDSVGDLNTWATRNPDHTIEMAD